MPIGTGDPKYDFYIVRVNKQTGEVENIPNISLQGLQRLGVHDGEWKPGFQGLKVSVSHWFDERPTNWFITAVQKMHKKGLLN